MNDPSDSTTELGENSESPEPPERLCLDVVHDDGDWSRFPDFVVTIQAAGQALSDVVSPGAGRASACIALSSDARVHALNATYRGQHKPTNVLSFPAGDMPGMAEDARFLGDVVLASETLLAEAVERHVLPSQHLQHLVIHGVLHLLGYDHVETADAETMERLEVEILNRLGIANPYDDARSELLAAVGR